MSVSVALAASLSWSGTAGALPPLDLAPVPKDRPEESRAGDCADGREAARQYKAGEYAEAAALYEGCARTTGDAGFWKKAGMARYSARQYAHAIQALGGYPGAASAEDRPIVAMLRDAQAQCVLVRFAVTADAGAPRPEQLRLAPQGRAAEAITVAWSRSTVALDVWLDPGVWQAQLVLPAGASVAPQEVTVARDPPGQEVAFRVEAPAPAVVTPPPPPSPVRVAVEVGPSAALRGGATVAWSGPTTTAPQTTRASTTRWDLAPGTWTVRASAPRFAAEARTLTVAEPTRVTLTLTRTREDRARIGLAAAIGAVGLGLFVGGLAGAAGAGRDYRGAAGRLAGDDRSDALAEVLPAIQRESTGTMITTSGLGAGVAAATIAADGSERLLGTEVGVGSVLLIIGLAWLIPTKRSYYKDAVAQDDGWSIDRTFLDDHRRPELAAGALLGLGAGLAAGASVALITRAALRGGRSVRKAKVGPMTGPRTVGLNFQASF
ncbi:MAG: hypothetical protein JNL82_17715 [Myxococcales bacterium]|nr:hypothetical protein [Myxococcales bacterium]